MKSRKSWLVLTGMVLAFGGCAAYYGLVYDWRGRFGAEDLSIAVEASDRSLAVTLRNTGQVTLMVYDDPGLGAPFNIRLVSSDGGEPIQATRAAANGRVGYALPLKHGEELARSAALRALFPEAAPGRYTLRVAYDPAAAAERGDPCAENLTLGRVEAEPVMITLGAGR